MGHLQVQNAIITMMIIFRQVQIVLPDVFLVFIYSLYCDYYYCCYCYYYQHQHSQARSCRQKLGGAMPAAKDHEILTERLQTLFCNLTILKLSDIIWDVSVATLQAIR